MIPLRLFAVGPKSETAAKPMKNPRVAPVSPPAGVPIVAKLPCGSSFMVIFPAPTVRKRMTILEIPSQRAKGGNRSAREP